MAHNTVSAIRSALAPGTPKRMAFDALVEYLDYSDDTELNYTLGSNGSVESWTLTRVDILSTLWSEGGFTPDKTVTELDLIDVLWENLDPKVDDVINDRLDTIAAMYSTSRAAVQRRILRAMILVMGLPDVIDVE